MSYLLYTVLGDGMGAERVTQIDCDPVEQAGIIDRTLLPVLHTGKGWADSRQSGYTVDGIIHKNAASFLLIDNGALIAWLGVALSSKVAPRVWSWVTDGKYPDEAPPAAPWAVLRGNVPAWVQPDWIDWWAKHVGYALLTREGW